MVAGQKMYDSNGNKFYSNFESIEEANKEIAELAERGITAVVGPKAPCRDKYGNMVPNRSENAVGVFIVSVPEKRDAHKALAREIITDLHGKEEYEKAVNLSSVLFTENFSNLTKEDIEEIFNPNEIINITSTNLVDLLIEVGAAKSKREAREFISGNAVKINGEKNTSLEYNLMDKDFIDNTYIIIKRGKKNYYVGKRN